ncbi:MAG: aminotransferase class I/II-fold pyridoxal phosphate-dependent enzyme, partial [Gemmatimonadales bacterium]
MTATPGPATLAVWGGELDRSTWNTATQVPLVQSTSFGHPDVEAWLDVALKREPGHIYSRNSNPTVAVFEDKVRLLEGADAATAFASGMAAVSGVLFGLLRPGDRVVSVKDSYGGTNQLFLHFLPRIGIEATLVDTEDHAAIEAEIAKGCRLVYLETPTNPTLKVLDIARLAAAATRQGALVVVDNTFSTPINTRPLELGADLVLHSATKFLGGHEDALGGVVTGRRDLIEQIHHYREITGAALAPAAAYLLIRGMKTLALRVKAQNANALVVARALEEDARIRSVKYPGLASHPAHANAKAQMRGFGAVLAFE